MSDEQATQQELDALGRVYALTEALQTHCQAIEIAGGMRDALAEVIAARSWAQAQALYDHLVVYVDAELAALQGAMDAMQALERDAAAQETLAAWRGFLEREEEHAAAVVA